MGREELGTGAGAEDWVEYQGDLGVRLVPFRRVPFRRLEGAQKTRDRQGDFAGAKHTDLDARGGEVGGEIVEGAAEEGWVCRLNFSHAES